MVIIDAWYTCPRKEDKPGTLVLGRRISLVHLSWEGD